MTYKLVCIDLDGTLLNGQCDITERTKESLKRIKDTEIKIAISTGRLYIDAIFFSEILGFKVPILCANGAYIREKDDDHVVYKNIIKADTIKKIRIICKEYGVTPCFATPEKMYYGLEYLEVHEEMNRLSKEYNRPISKVERIFVPNDFEWERVLDMEKDDIIKGEIFISKKYLTAIRKDLESMGEIEVVSSRRDSLEFTCKGVSKGRAVEILASFYNLQPSEVIAIGDSENDLSMLKFAGFGVAMGNATDEVKKASDYITDSNDNDGVAKALEEIFS